MNRNMIQLCPLLIFPPAGTDIFLMLFAKINRISEEIKKVPEYCIATLNEYLHNKREANEQIYCC